MYLVSPIDSNRFQSIPIDSNRFFQRRHGGNSDRTVSAVFCPDCPRRSFRRQYLLDEHIIEVHKPEEKTVECDECDVKFASERLRDKHKVKEHSPVDEDGEGDGENGTTMARARSTKLHVCHICAKTFRSSGKLQEHMATHDESGPTECCPVCPKVFA